MIDLRWLREQPGAFDDALRSRGATATADAILALDAEKRALETRLQEDQARRNQLSREIGQVHKGRPPDDLLAELGALKDRVKFGEERLRAADARLETELLLHPNPPDPEVPIGSTADDNVEVRRWGEPPAFSFVAKAHDDLGSRLGMDFERAARLSGARFVTLWGALARLERALAAFMLDLQAREHGYTEVAVPLLVREEALVGTGQLPKMAEDLFRTTGEHWLIPTSEVSLTNLFAGEIIDEAALPLRLTACTPCFRAEAGAAGRDTRGMIRQHQFTKVELVSITSPEGSADEHERMTACAEEVLRRLGLAYRVVLLCTGDMGFAARKTYDLEVWLPGQGAYREISSCSNCGDFQARRMRTRARARDAKATRAVHTLNGSGLAVGRTLVAVLENYQEADGGVRIPEALLPFMSPEDREAGRLSPKM